MGDVMTVNKQKHLEAYVESPSGGGTRILVIVT